MIMILVVRRIILCIANQHLIYGILLKSNPLSFKRNPPSTRDKRNIYIYIYQHETHKFEILTSCKDQQQLDLHKFEILDWKMT